MIRSTVNMLITIMGMLIIRNTLGDVIAHLSTVVSCFTITSVCFMSNNKGRGVTKKIEIVLVIKHKLV